MRYGYEKFSLASRTSGTIPVDCKRDAILAARMANALTPVKQK